MRGLGACRRGGEGVGAGLERIERLLHLELDLLRRLIAQHRGPARLGAGAVHGGGGKAAVEELPVQQERHGAEVAPAAEVVALVVDPGVDPERERRPAVRIRHPDL